MTISKSCQNPHANAAATLKAIAVAMYVQERGALQAAKSALKIRFAIIATDVAIAADAAIAIAAS